MKTSSHKPETIDEYISLHPPKVQELLEKIRMVIKKAAPDAIEAIKYQIPTFVLNGNLVHFGAYKNHIGFYPGPSGITVFKQELSVYESGKGSIQFPLDKEIPFDMIGRIVQFRVQENLEKVTNETRKTSISID
ncbi:MAG: iron chaperone [Sphingobacterium thalpophilum]